MFICIHAFGDIAFDLLSIVYPVFERWCGIAYQLRITFSNMQRKASVLELVTYAGDLRLRQHVVDVHFFMVFGLLMISFGVALILLLGSALIFMMSFTFAVLAEDSCLEFRLLRSAVVLAFSILPVSALIAVVA